MPHPLPGEPGRRLGFAVRLVPGLRLDVRDEAFGFLYINP